jgi:hypothetical protein
MDSQKGGGGMIVGTPYREIIGALMNSSEFLWGDRAPMIRRGSYK